MKYFVDDVINFAKKRGVPFYLFKKYNYIFLVTLDGYRTQNLKDLKGGNFCSKMSDVFFQDHYKVKYFMDNSYYKMISLEQLFSEFPQGV